MAKPNGLCIRSVEFRAAEPEEGGDGRTMEGYAAVFGQPTRIDSWEGRFDEELAPGCFSKTLRERKPIIQFDHGHDVRTGSVPIAQLMDAKEDKQGLHVKARMFDNPVVEPIRQAIAGGAIHGMSFRFQPVRDEWRDQQGKLIDDPDELEQLLYGHGRANDSARLPLKRTIREVKLFEMGPVVNPAYEGTSIGVRSANELTDEDRAALMAEYRRTMVRSAASDGDNDEDDTMVFDHFNTDVPLREDGLPDVSDEEYEANEAEGRAAKDTKKPYGDVDYADPGYQDDGKHRYPLDTAEHAKAAWDYINKEKNQEPYSSEELSKIMSKIKAACKKFGIEISDDSEKSVAVKAMIRAGFDPKVVEAAAVASQTTGAARQGTPESNTEAARSGTSETKKTNEPRKAGPTLKTKDEFEARNAEIAERLKTIAEENAERALDDSLQQEWDELSAERAANDKQIKGIEERAALLLRHASNPANREAGEGTSRKAPAFHPERSLDVDEIRNSSYGRDDYERKVTDTARFAIDKADYARQPKQYRDLGGAPAGDVAHEVLRNVDKPSQLAERMLDTGSEAYYRAFAKVLAHQSDIMLEADERSAWIKAQTRAQSLGTDSAGGFAVPFQLDPTIILTNAGVVNPIRDVARIEQITGKEYDLVASAGATATRGAEAAVAPDSSITLSQPNIRTNRVQAFVPFSYELEQAMQQLRGELTRVLVDAKEREEDSFWTGDGTGVNPQGVVGYVTGAQYVTTAGVGALATADVYSLQAALAPRWERNATWAGHKAIYNKIRQFDTAGGNALWARIGDGQPPRLMDYPDVRVSAMSNAVTTGNVVLVYGDFSQYIIVDRIGMHVELVPNLLDTATGRPTGQRGIFAIWMNNGKRLTDTAFQQLKIG